MDSIQGEIDCLKDEAGFVRLADHGVIELTGEDRLKFCLLYTSPSPRDATLSRMPSSA